MPQLPAVVAENRPLLPDLQGWGGRRTPFEERPHVFRVQQVPGMRLCLLEQTSGNTLPALRVLHGGDGQKRPGQVSCLRPCRDRAYSGELTGSVSTKQRGASGKCSHDGTPCSGTRSMDV